MAGHANITVATDQERTHTHAHARTCLQADVAFRVFARKISIGVYFFFLFALRAVTASTACHFCR